MDKLPNLESILIKKAQFKTVIALNLSKEQHLFTGIAKGKIIKEKSEPRFCL
jgi:XTP/dITP diphosphohydrolase